MGKIVIPKNSAGIEEVMGAIQIYYDVDDWLSNYDFIQMYKERIGIIGDDTDSSAYTKKTEIGAYYGFIEWEDISRTQSPRRITKRGRRFLEHYNQNDIASLHEDIMQSLEEISFGRNNYACRSCDSDIEPPALYIRAVIDLGYLTNQEFAFLVYNMENKGKHYTDTILEIKEKRNMQEKIELPDDAKKFADPKPILILERWGVLSSRQNGASKETIISNDFYEKYENRLKNLKIYNVDKTHKDEQEIEKKESKLSKEKKKIVNLPKLTPRKKSNYSLNNILYGAPGTGKTYSTALYAVAISESKELNAYSDISRKEIMSKYNELIKKGKVVFTTFHQNYGYEDFIQGIRPNTDDGNMNFSTVNGVFKEISEKAIADSKSDYIIIIDEINRANISKVFGELITLIEEDKRWGEENAVCVTLPSGDVFAVPNNLFIIGTMNSADKSISLIDTALRRRFDFIEFEPNADLIEDEVLRNVLISLNKGISEELGSTDLLIGHSYFMKKTKEDLCDILNRNIIPLLYEYFFDNQKKVEAQLKQVIGDLEIDIKKGTVGRIKLVKKGH